MVFAAIVAGRDVIDFETFFALRNRGSSFRLVASLPSLFVVRFTVSHDLGRREGGVMLLVWYSVAASMDDALYASVVMKLEVLVMVVE